MTDLLQQAITHHRANELPEAESLYRAILQAQPNHPDANHNLGVLAVTVNQAELALPFFKKALENSPNEMQFWLSYIETLIKTRQFDLAKSVLNQGRERGLSGEKVELLEKHLSEPTEAEINKLLTLFNQRKYSEAESFARDLVQHFPNHGIGWKGLGAVVKEQGGRTAEAITYMEKAADLLPFDAETHKNLGSTFTVEGNYAKAEISLRKAIEIFPNSTDARSKLLVVMNSCNFSSPQSCLEEAKRFGEIAKQQVTGKFITWKSDLHPNKLRVGIVSGDFWDHAVCFFLENLLTQIDATKIELFAYSTYQKTDSVTERVKPYFAEWKPIFNLNDANAAQLIHDDAIHILIDLSGHTNHNRASLFAWKPAKIQMAWLGYWATTGIAEMDYILVDEVSVPKENQWHFTEEVRYLPNTRLCFSAPKFDISVAQLPALTNGYITFGCFQNLSKITDAVLKLWSKIFKQLPNARLRIQSKPLSDKNIVGQLLSRLVRYGIDETQVITHGASTREDYLNAHSQVDFILDTFPYTGGTTTCEALWMGVPTLTLMGDTLISRQGASLLSAAGLNDWVVDNQTQYVEKAISFASDLNALAKRRATLREQVLSSPIFDAKQFARNFENVLWEINSVT